jgi:hypothetical protein
MSLVVSRIPKRTFELTYGLKFNPKTKLTADYVLDAFAISKSIMSQNGVPNASRVARIMLKDYVCGKLLYCHPPPKMKPKEGSELVEYISEGEEEGVEEDDDDDDDEYFTDDDDEKDDEENDHDFNEENVNEVKLKEKEKKTKTNEILSNILDVKVKDVEEATYVVEEKNVKHSRVKDSSKKYRVQEHKKKSIYSPIPVSELRKISKK